MVRAGRGLDPSNTGEEAATDGVGGSVAALGTAGTRDSTAATWSTSMAIGIGMSRDRKENPFGRYEGPNSDPDSRWLGRGREGPYADDYEKAKDGLQLPAEPDRWREVDVPFYKPVRGPRPANKHPEWGQGGGPEYYRGWRFPE